MFYCPQGPGEVLISSGPGSPCPGMARGTTPTGAGASLNDSKDTPQRYKRQRKHPLGHRSSMRTRIRLRGTSVCIPSVLSHMPGGICPIKIHGIVHKVHLIAFLLIHVLIGSCEPLCGVPHAIDDLDKRAVRFWHISAAAPQPGGSGGAGASQIQFRSRFRPGAHVFYVTHYSRPAGGPISVLSR